MSIAHLRLSPQFRECVIHLVARNWATLDVDQTMGVAPEKTDHAILGVNGDATSIAVLFGRWNDWSHRNIAESANTLQNVADLAPFDRELMFVVDVLISTTAATAKVWAFRRNAMQ